MLSFVRTAFVSLVPVCLFCLDFFAFFFPPCQMMAFFFLCLFPPKGISWKSRIFGKKFVECLLAMFVTETTTGPCERPRPVKACGHPQKIIPTPVNILASTLPQKTGSRKGNTERKKVVDEAGEEAGRVSFCDGMAQRQAQSGRSRKRRTETNC